MTSQDAEYGKMDDMCQVNRTLHCTQHTLHCTLYNTRCTLHTAHYTLHIVHLTAHKPQAIALLDIKMAKETKSMLNTLVTHLSTLHCAALHCTTLSISISLHCTVQLFHYLLLEDMVLEGTADILEQDHRCPGLAVKYTAV